MPVLIDDQNVPLTGRNLRELLASAREHLAESGRVVVEVKLDGQAVTGDALDSETPTPEQAEVRVYTAEPGDLAAGVLEQVREQLQAASGMQEEAADLLQQDEANQALDLIRGSVDGWLQSQQAVAQTAELMHLDLSRVEVTGEDDTVVQRMQELIQRLVELKELIQANDFVSLADALAYEWPQVTENWDQAIASIIKVIEQG
ncbi:MAG: hypothetical protein AAGC44_11940 [Planctomycetota bacterium]